MTPKNLCISLIVSIVGLMGFVMGCSTEKDALINKGYHNMTARYNGYFNANVLIDEALESYRAGAKEDYTQILPLQLYPSVEDASDLFGPMDEAIEKCETVILRHSMPNPARVKNKDVEHCRWIDDNWLVIGRAHYIKGEYLLAVEKLTFVMENYVGEESKYVAQIWLAKTYIALGNYPEAARILKLQKGAIDKAESWKEEWKKMSRSSKKKYRERQKKDKKKGIKKPAPYPKKLKKDYEITMAELYIAQGDYKKAIEHLEAGIALTKNRKEKARYMYVLAQLYGIQGNGQQASYYYNKVAHSNAPYEMRFKAQINKALTASSGGAELRKELRKMLKDGKNMEYRDQIYYALAELDIKDGNDSMAMVNYGLSAFYSVNNDYQKGLSYLKLADLHFDKKHYLKAQKYYDSCVQVLPEDFEGYQSISAKADGLSDLVYNYDTYIFEDSVQTIASMEPKERDKFLEQKRKSIIEEEKKRKEEEEAKLLAQQNKVNFQATNQGDGNKWYFYNLKVRTSGFNDFRSLWGQRLLEDNWRRSNKSSLNSFDENDPEIIDSLSENTIDSLTVEDLLVDIPLTPEALDSSNNRLMNSLYNLGIIYKDRLGEIGEAINYFTLVVDRGVEHPKVLPAMYQLYLIYFTKGSSKAEVYKQRILQEFPDSEIAMILKDPDYLKKKEEQEKKDFNEYSVTLEDYRYRRYAKVLTACNTVIANDPDNTFINKYYLLKAYAIANTQPGNTEAIKSPLQDLYAASPDSEEGKLAKYYLDKIDGGESIIDNNGSASNSIYNMDLSKKHFFVLVFPVDKGQSGPTQIKLSNFNKEYFRSEGLTVQSSQIPGDTKNQLLVVRIFPNHNRAKTYNDAFKSEKAKAQLGNLATDFVTFLISVDNFTQLYKSKDLDAYIKFFQEEYPS